MDKKSILSEEIVHLDLEETTTIKDLVEAFKHCAIQGRSIARCAEVYEQMLGDGERPTIIMTLAGTLFSAGLRKVVRDAIVYNMVDVIVSTGAILDQDFCEALGFRHYIGSPRADDAMLRDMLIDRIYDTYFDEEEQRIADARVCEIADGLVPRNYSSREFMRILGEQVDDEQSVLYNANKYGVPIFVPALNDSCTGIGLVHHYVHSKREGRTPMTIDPIRDFWELTQIKLKSKETGLVVISGGVPKNYTQDIVVVAETLGFEVRAHKYAIQVTTDAPQWGALSGCTLEEGRSWGKIAKDSHNATAYVEATIGLPLIMGYLLGKDPRRARKRLRFNWLDDELLGIV